MFLFFQKSFLSYFLYTACPFYNNVKERRGGIWTWVWMRRRKM